MRTECVHCQKNITGEVFQYPESGYTAHPGCVSQVNYQEMDSWLVALRLATGRR